jgi:hypothetical protein
MEEPSHIRLAIEGPPPPNDGMDPFDHLPQCERRLPPRELSDLLAKSRDRFLPWDGIQVERGRPPAAFGRREAMACTLFHRVAEELKALADMHNARLLRVQPDPEFLMEQSFGGRQRSLGLCSGAAQHDKVVGPARQTEACCGHLSVKWCEEDIGPQRTGYTSYKVANMLVEFSTSIPRTQLRPGYGDGFLGAPLQIRQALKNPTPREQGEQRGSSTTPSQQNPGGAPYV